MDSGLGNRGEPFFFRLTEIRKSAKSDHMQETPCGKTIVATLNSSLSHFRSCSNKSCREKAEQWEKMKAETAASLKRFFKAS